MICDNSQIVSFYKHPAYFSILFEKQGDKTQLSQLGVFNVRSKEKNTKHQTPAWHKQLACNCWKAPSSDFMINNVSFKFFRKCCLMNQRWYLSPYYYECNLQLPCWWPRMSCDWKTSIGDSLETLHIFSLSLLNSFTLLSCSFSSLLLPCLSLHFFIRIQKAHEFFFARYRRRSTDRLYLGLSGQNILCFTGEIRDLVSETHPPDPHSYNWKKTKLEGITELIIHPVITCQCLNFFILWHPTVWHKVISASP